MLALADCCRSEQSERSLAGGSGRGVVDGERLAVGVRDRELCVEQFEAADLWVVHHGGAAALGPDVVARPELPELVAAQGELADQLGQPRVVDVGADVGTQGGDGAAE